MGSPRARVCWKKMEIWENSSLGEENEKRRGLSEKEILIYDLEFCKGSGIMLEVEGSLANVCG